MDEPRSPQLVIVKSRLSPESWRARVEAAQKADALLARIAARVKQGDTLNEATAGEAPRSRRSWVMRHWKRWQKEGVEALIDARLPREPTLVDGGEDPRKFDGCVDCGLRPGKETPPATSSGRGRGRRE